jgi:hypothetical protein
MNTTRSRFRFSLRVLLAVVTAIAVFLGGWQSHKWWVSHKLKQSQLDYSVQVDFVGEVIMLRGPKKEVDRLADLIRQIETLTLAID